MAFKYRHRMVRERDTLASKLVAATMLHDERQAHERDLTKLNEAEAKVLNLSDALAAEKLRAHELEVELERTRKDATDLRCEKLTLVNDLRAAERHLTEYQEVWQRMLDGYRADIANYRRDAAAWLAQAAALERVVTTASKLPTGR